MLDDRLSLSVTTPDGLVKRWGPDEADGGDIPADTQFGTSVPGGFRDLSCSLLRDLNPRADEGLFYDVRAYGAGNQSAWEGRIGSLPRDNTKLSPTAVGWSAHLTDDKSFREIYADRDRSKWGASPLDTQVYFASLGTPWSLAELQWNGLSVPYPAQALPAYVLGMTTHPNRLPIAYMMYKGSHITLPTGYGVYVMNAPDPWTGTYTETALTLDSTLRTNTFAAARAAVTIWARSAGVSRTPARGSMSSLSDVALYGNHGLTAYDPGDGTTWGFLSSDIIANIVSRAAPLLRYTTGSTGTIQPTSFVNQHMVFDQPTTAADAIATVNAAEVNEWAVWEDRTFYFNPPDRESTVWAANLSEGAHITGEGDSGEDMINGVIVTYTDATGTKRMVGPPGTTGADTTDASLQDTDPLNPVNKAGIPRKWDILDLSVTSYSAYAIAIGAAYLYEKLLARRKGTLTFTGPQRLQDQGAQHPAWAIRAGHACTITDRPGEPVRRIIETRYDHRTRQTTATLDSTRNDIDAILDRLSIGSVGVYA